MEMVNISRAATPRAIALAAPGVANSASPATASKFGPLKLPR